MSRFYLLLFTVIVLMLSSVQAQTYTRSRKNWIISAEAGMTQASGGFMWKYSGKTGWSAGGGVGKYLSTRATGILPVSVRIQYHFINFYPMAGEGIYYTGKEHSITIPIQTDLEMFSFSLGKSKHKECMYLHSILSVAFLPGMAFGSNISGERWTLPAELGYSFHISRSGGHKSVAGKDIMYTLFARTDLSPRFVLNDAPYHKVRLTSFGFRFQYTRFKISKFSDM
jgi:hypothetical protein